MKKLFPIIIIALLVSFNISSLGQPIGSHSKEGGETLKNPNSVVVYNYISEFDSIRKSKTEYRYDSNGGIIRKTVIKR